MLLRTCTGGAVLVDGCSGDVFAPVHGEPAAAFAAAALRGSPGRIR